MLWTIPTFGLFISSFRPAELILTTGWWTIFQNPGFTLDNYRDVLFSPSQSSPQLGAYFVNSLSSRSPRRSSRSSSRRWRRTPSPGCEFRFVNLLFIIVFALQIVPLQMALVPLLQIFSTGSGPGRCGCTT